MNIHNLIAVLNMILREHDHKSGWSIPLNCPIPIPDSLKDGYERNVYLKECLHPVIGGDNALDCHYWIIQEWGGIGSFKKNARNNLRIQAFLGRLETAKLKRSEFECISSLSKVASFIDPTKYAIYDSRAIYTLNWILFAYANATELFPQPIGRSADLAKYDQQTIFRLSGRRHSYRDYKVSFHEYCNLMRSLSSEVFGEGSKPYRMEMLLFAIAPSWILQDIEKSVSLAIATNA